MMTEPHSNTISWNFDNSYSKLPEELFQVQAPVKVSSPLLLLFNSRLAQELGLKGSSGDFTNIFSGNAFPEGSKPISQAYAGHQFGHFTMLGDGRAVLLGEQITPNGKRFDIQLKGSGRTPYSRGGDGRATVSAMLREYIMSEALFALGIPTSQSLAVVATGEPVFRETAFPGAVLTRVASSHIRVGTFEFVARFTPQHLKAFSDYTIQRHYPEVMQDKNPYLALLKKVMEKQADLICDWMRVGFIHGVMNTDNMTISGETIDYGPCAFMNAYNPQTVFSSIDHQGRYAFGNQPKIAQWNLACLAGALMPLFSEDKKMALSMAREALDSFPDLYETQWLNMMRKKLGLNKPLQEDENLIQKLLKIMTDAGADYTLVFKHLSYYTSDDSEFFQSTPFIEWVKERELRLESESCSKQEVLKQMQNENPVYIPRNHIVEEALNEAANEGDFEKTKKLLDVLSKPYTIRKGHEYYELAPKEGDLGYKTFCGT